MYRWTLILTVVTTGLLLVADPATSYAEDLVGTWEQVDLEEETIIRIEFGEGGLFYFEAYDFERGRYEIKKGKNMVGMTELDDLKGEYIEWVGYELKDGKLILSADDYEKMYLKQLSVPPKPTNPLVGRWEVLYMVMGDEKEEAPPGGMLLEFKNDGTGWMMELDEFMEGYFGVPEDGVIEMTLIEGEDEEQETKVGEFWFKDGELTIDINGDVKTFTRVD